MMNVVQEGELSEQDLAELIAQDEDNDAAQIVDSDGNVVTV